MEVSLTDILEARDARAKRQQVLLQQYLKPLISFTMNIAGPIKNSPSIARGFRIGLRELTRLITVERIPCLYQEQLQQNTGCEALLVLDAPAAQIKALTVQLEEASPLGRLFDLDVLDEFGTHLNRPVPRQCLLCGEKTQVCARNRSHSVVELQARTQEILENAFLESDSRLAASLAQQALLYEVGITPKPGLVDRANNGSHQDMDFFTFQRSIAVLYPYFETCVRIGRATRMKPPTATLDALRFHGKQAEGDMLAATGGINTHKGAIFSLGLLCGALGRLDRELWSTETILALCGKMAAFLPQELHTGGDTAGQRLYQKYGITGIRGQAAAGYPAVQTIGLPTLEAGLARGLSINDSACAALLALMAEIQDTNLIHRGGITRYRQTVSTLSRLLEETPFPDWNTLVDLDTQFIREKLSPGGSADLLSMTLMLHFLKESNEAEKQPI